MFDLWILANCVEWELSQQRDDSINEEPEMTTMSYPVTISRNPESVTPNMSERLIIVRFKSPARAAAIAIPAEPWERMKREVPLAYAGLLDAVLEKAAKDILASTLASFTTWPSEIDALRFTFDALMEQASGSNTGWLNKEELAAAWKASATRKAFYGDSRFGTNPAYRKAVGKFEELILKMAAKNAAYREEELDKILAKLEDDDLVSEFGTFIVRRIEQIRNKPMTADVDLDLL
jgi:hypothetical protein